MPDEFQVGELVVMQKADFWKEYDGVPAVVIGPYVSRYTIDLRAMKEGFAQTYDVRILADPLKCVCARPDQLRKLRDDPPVAEREQVRCNPVEELIGEEDAV